MNATERFGSLAARAALAAIFVISGFGKLASPAAAGGYIASKGLPEPALLAGLAGLVELAGGLLLLAGLKTRVAAVALAAFLVPATALFHNPIGLAGAEAHLQQIQLLKNLAIAGGLLAVATFGPGALSLDARRGRRRAPRAGTLRVRTAHVAGAGLLGLGLASLAGCGPSEAAKKNEADAKAYAEAQAVAKAHLENFDDLDFNVFTNQKWDEFPKSHAKDITVFWPDGHATKGLEKHIEDLKAMFVWAPDTRIKEHPVKVAQGEWTSVIGVMEGTFTKPMPIGDGKAIPPTGKAYKIRMATVGHWKDGVMTEEYLFWDNQEFMKEIGLGK